MDEIRPQGKTGVADGGVLGGPNEKSDFVHRETGEKSDLCHEAWEYRYFGL